jgi:hypothetical protein
MYSPRLNFSCNSAKVGCAKAGAESSAAKVTHATARYSLRIAVTPNAKNDDVRKRPLAQRLEVIV